MAGPASERNPQSEQAARGAFRSVRGRKSAVQFFQNLSQLTAQGAVVLNDAFAAWRVGGAATGVAVVLSDFLDPAGYEAGLHALVARGFQVSAVQILAPEEVTPGAYGDLHA